MICSQFSSLKTAAPSDPHTPKCAKTRSHADSEARTLQTDPLPEDRSSILADMHAEMELPLRDTELVQIVDASLTEAARRAGEWLVCRPGCTQCCYGAFAINQLDVLRLRAGMDALRTAQPERAAEIERRAQHWIDEHGRDFPGDLATGILGETDVERERFEEFANEAACPALDPATGLCDVYEWRPMACRVFGPPVAMDAGDGGGPALAHCELCFAGAGSEQVAACEMVVPNELEESFVDELEREGLRGETVVAFAVLGSYSASQDG
jgi:Fe-S-cluster containining protein